MLLATIAAHAQAHPDKTAFIHNGTPCSYAQWSQRLQRTVAFLAGCGLPAQGVALLDIAHLAQAWTVGIALRHLGLTTLCIAGSQDAAAYAHLAPCCCVTWAAEDAPGTARPPADPACRWIALPLTWEAPDPAQLHPARAAAGHILQTSGTTGASKMVLRDPVAEASTLGVHADINQMQPTSVVYVRDFPLSTAGGYRWPLLAWHLGATVVFQQWHDFQVPFLDGTLTHAFGTPMTLLFALRAPEPALRRHDHLRLMVTGGALPPALLDALHTLLTRQVFAVLASTEALTLGATPLDSADDLGWHCIHPARTVQVVDEADVPLAAGQMGLLRVQVLDGLRGYLGDAAASQAFFRDGYFYPGDLAVVRADGRLALCGRAADVINVLGSKVATAPLEADLQRQLGVDAVCLMALARPGHAEQVVVAIECQQDPSPAALQHAARHLLDTFGRVHFHCVRQLPRNRMGKVLRLVLQQHLRGLLH